MGRRPRRYSSTGAYAPLPDSAERPPVGPAHSVAGSEVYDPVRLQAEAQPALGLVLVDADVLFGPELLLPEVGDLPARGVHHPYPPRFRVTVSTPQPYVAGTRMSRHTIGSPGYCKPGPHIGAGLPLTSPDKVRDEGVAVVVALAHPVGGVRHVHEGHDGGDRHHRDEEEAD